MTKPAHRFTTQVAVRGGLKLKVLRIRVLTWLLVGLALGFSAVGAAVGPVQAQTTSDQIPTRSFITPFPEDDVYDVKIYGDSWADGLLNAANRILAKDARLRINRKVQKLNGITSSRWDRAVRAVDGLSETNVPEIAIVMAGAFDQSPIRQANGRRIRLRDQAAWQAGYAERVERILRAFATKRVAVYWIGQPITRGARRRAHANLINEIVRSAARRSRVKFIDTYDMFADEAGGYSDYGADLEGKVRRLRWKDGLHFMAAGYDKIAHFIEREVRRDLRQARQERSVDLLGDDVAQKAIRASAKQGEPAATSTWSSILTPFLGGQKTDGRSGDPAKARQRAILDQETAVVTVPQSARTTTNGTTSTSGPLTIRIERPAVPATIVALVRQRSSRDQQSKFGDQVLLKAPDGTPLISSVTPVNRGTYDLLQSRNAPTQTAIFKVWAKGERLAPRANRADDTSWPRPQPVILIPRQEPPVAGSRRIDPLLAFDRLRTEPVWSGPPLPTRNPRSPY